MPQSIPPKTNPKGICKQAKFICSMKNYFRTFLALITLALLFTPLQKAQAVGTPAGTTLNNIAVVNYLNADGTQEPSVQSPVCAVQVKASYGVGVSPTTGTVSGQPANAVYYPMSVTNSGNASDNFNGVVTDTKNWKTQIIQDDNADGVHQSSEITALTNTGSLPADGSKKYFLLVNIPEGAGGESDAVTVKWTSASNSAVTASASLQVNAAQKVAVSVTSTSSSASALPGKTCSLPVIVTNTGSGTDTFTLTLSDSSSWTSRIIRDDNADGILQTTETTVVKDTGSLNAGSSFHGILQVDIPSTVSGGVKDTVQVKAVSTVDTSVSGNLSVAVTSQSAVNLQLSPQSATLSGKPGSIVYMPFSLTNTGNAADQFNAVLSSVSGWSAQVLQDANGDGIHQDTETTAVTTTGSLTAGSTSKYFLAVTIPATATSGSSEDVTLKWTSSNDSTVSSSIAMHVDSNVAVIGLTLDPASAIKNGSAGSTCYLPITLTNTGSQANSYYFSFTDQYGWTMQVLADDNQDGIRQSSETTSILNTGSLNAGSSLKAFVAVEIPTSAKVGLTDSIHLTALCEQNTSIYAQTALQMSVTGYSPNWKIQIGTPIYGTSSSGDIDGKALIGAEDGNLYAISCRSNNGKVIWTYSTGGAIRGKPLACMDPMGRLNVAYFTSNNGYAYAINSKGKVLWSTQVADSGTSLEETPSLWNGILYVSAGKFVVGLNAVTGQVVYKSPALVGTKLTSPVIVPGNGYVVVGSDAGYLYNLGTNLSGVRWSKKLDSAISGAPVCAQSQVFAGTTGGFLYAYDTVWGTANGGVTLSGGITGDMTLEPVCNWLLFGTSAHNVYALNDITGQIPSYYWPVTPSGSGEIHASILTVTNGAGDEKFFTAGKDGLFHMSSLYDPTSESVYNAGSPFVGSPSPCLCGNAHLVIQGGTDGYIYGFPLE